MPRGEFVAGAALRRLFDGVGGSALLLLLALALLVSSCAEPRLRSDLRLDEHSSRVDVFVRASGPPDGSVWLELGDVALRTESGALEPLELSSRRISSEELRRRFALAGAAVPRANYVELVVELTAAGRVVDGREVPLRLLPQGLAELDVLDSLAEDDAPLEGVPVSYRIPLDLQLRSRDAASVFVEWDVTESIRDGSSFRLVVELSAETPRANLSSLYVTDAATSAVLSVDRSTGEVVSTGKTGVGPLGLAISGDRRRLFVANGGEGSMTVLDVRRNVVTATVPIRFAAGSSDVAIDDGSRVALVTNPGLDSVSFIALDDNVRLDDVRVGRGPRRVVVSPTLRRAYVLDTLSDTLTVLDLNSRQVVSTVATESRPTDLAIDAREREVYVVHEFSPNLLVFDAESLVRTSSVFVGVGMSAVCADRRRQRVHVARGTPPEFAVVDRRLASVIRRIPVSGEVVQLVMPRQGPLIYGAAPDLGGLVVVNPVLGEEQPLIPCGARPTDVVVLE